MKEIEIKLAFEDKEKVLNRLKELGAIFKEKYDFFKKETKQEIIWLSVQLPRMYLLKSY